MFLWITLPSNASSMELFDLAVKEKVVFVPGSPFYINDNEENAFRLNFSFTDKQTTETGIKRLGVAARAGITHTLRQSVKKNLLFSQFFHGW